jgi:hypothetical protein
LFVSFLIFSVFFFSLLSSPFLLTELQLRQVKLEKDAVDEKKSWMGRPFYPPKTLTRRKTFSFFNLYLPSFPYISSSINTKYKT